MDKVPVDSRSNQELRALFFRNEIKSVPPAFLKEAYGKFTFEEKEKLRTSKGRILKLNGEYVLSFVLKMISGLSALGTVFKGIVSADVWLLLYGLGFILVFLFTKKAKEAIRKVKADLVAFRRENIKQILSWYFAPERLSAEGKRLWECRARCWF